MVLAAGVEVREGKDTEWDKVAAEGITIALAEPYAGNEVV
jgi:hypothetical protein